MAHSYTPGLKVLKKTIFKKERILPLKGDVLVKSGDQLTPETIVASTNLPGNVQMLKVSNILNIDPKDVVELHNIFRINIQYVTYFKHLNIPWKICRCNNRFRS